MDYKKLIKSRTVRIKLMRILSFVPDAWMVKIQYRLKTGHKLNLKNPQRYTEKLQWYKLNYRDPLMAKCVDKYEVREYVKQVGLENILNPIYGVYNSPEEVDWDQLPDQFVAKDTLGGGGNDVLICKDKSKLDRAKFFELLARWTQPVKGKHPGREWVYDNTQHRILIEQFMENDDQDLPDFKFFCFQGKVEYFYVRVNYAKHHDKGEMAFFREDSTYLPGYGFDYCRVSKNPILLPKNLDEMIRIAQKLSSQMPHVRVDLYDYNNRPVFGELTFFNASGYMNCVPDDFDLLLGDKFVLPKHK